jgi:hypothetical protein
MAFSKEVELNLHEEWKLKKSQDIIWLLVWVCKLGKKAQLQTQCCNYPFDCCVKQFQQFQLPLIIWKVFYATVWVVFNAGKGWWLAGIGCGRVHCQSYNLLVDLVWVWWVVDGNLVLECRVVCCWNVATLEVKTSLSFCLLVQTSRSFIQEASRGDFGTGICDGMVVRRKMLWTWWVGWVLWAIY